MAEKSMLLMTACSSGDIMEVERLLMSVSPNVSEPSNGNFPLHLAINSLHKPLVELLLRSGADPNVRNRDNKIPLHFACAFSSLNLVEMLLGAKSDPNVQDNEGCTPLHVNAMSGNANITQLLLKNSAFQLPNRAGKYPVHLVQKEGRIKMLLTNNFEASKAERSQREADINAKNKRLSNESIRLDREKEDSKHRTSSMLEISPALASIAANMSPEVLLPSIAESTPTAISSHLSPPVTSKSPAKTTTTTSTPHKRGKFHFGRFGGHHSSPPSSKSKQESPRSAFRDLEDMTIQILLREEEEDGEPAAAKGAISTTTTTTTTPATAATAAEQADEKSLLGPSMAVLETSAAFKSLLPNDRRSHRASRDLSLLLTALDASGELESASLSGGGSGAGSGFRSSGLGLNVQTSSDAKSHRRSLMLARGSAIAPPSIETESPLRTPSRPAPRVPIRTVSLTKSAWLRGAGEEGVAAAAEADGTSTTSTIEGGEEEKWSLMPSQRPSRFILHILSCLLASGSFALPSPPPPPPKPELKPSIHLQSALIVDGIEWGKEYDDEWNGVGVSFWWLDGYDGRGFDSDDEDSDDDEEDEEDEEDDLGEKKIESAEGSEDSELKKPFESGEEHPPAPPTTETTTTTTTTTTTATATATNAAAPAPTSSTPTQQPNKFGELHDMFTPPPPPPLTISLEKATVPSKESERKLDAKELQKLQKSSKGREDLEKIKDQIRRKQKMKDEEEKKKAPERTHNPRSMERTVSSPALLGGGGAGGRGKGPAPPPPTKPKSFGFAQSPAPAPAPSDRGGQLAPPALSPHLTHAIGSAGDSVSVHSSSKPKESKASFPAQPNPQPQPLRPHNYLDFKGPLTGTSTATTTTAPSSNAAKTVARSSPNSPSSPTTTNNTAATEAPPTMVSTSSSSQTSPSNHRRVPSVPTGGGPGGGSGRGRGGAAPIAPSEGGSGGGSAYRPTPMYVRHMSMNISSAPPRRMTASGPVLDTPPPSFNKQGKPLPPGSKKTYPLEVLQKTPRPDDVDLSMIEAHLSPEDFKAVFKMQFHEFESLPRWKQLLLRKRFNLF